MTDPECPQDAVAKARSKLVAVAEQHFQSPELDVRNERGKQVSKALTFTYAGSATGLIQKKSEEERDVIIPGNANNEVYELTLFDEILREPSQGQPFGDQSKVIIDVFFTEADHQEINGKAIDDNVFAELFEEIADRLSRSS